MNPPATPWEFLCGSTKSLGRLLLGQSAVINFALLAIPVYTIQIFDRVLITNVIESLFMLLAGVSIMGFAGFYFENLRQHTLNRFADYLNIEIKPLVLSRISSDTRQVAFDLEEFSQLTRTGSLTGILDTFWIPIALLVSVLIHPVLGAFVLLVNLGFAVTASLKMMNVAPLERQHLQKRTKRLTDLLTTDPANNWLKQHVATNAFGMEEQKFLKVDATLERRQKLVLQLHHGLKWAFQIGLPSLGALLLISSEITIGGFLAALIVASRSLLPFESLLAHTLLIQRAKPMIEQLKALLDVPEADAKIGFNEPVNGHVRLSAITTPDKEFGNPGVTELDLEAKPGDIIVLIGDASSGVNQPLRVLAGISQFDKGTATIDDIRLEDWNPSALAQGIGWLPADLEQPGYSILDLMTSFGTTSESHAMCIARDLGLNDLMIKWGLAYDDCLLRSGTEHTARLHQLVALTAVFNSEKPILLLEYPEQYLDLSQLKKLSWYLKSKAKQGRTIIFSTTSTNLLNIATESCLFNQGRISRQGNPLAMLEHRKSNNVQHIESARI